MTDEEEAIPILAIVGRQNVGKSSLFNALAKRRLSIVDPMPGVTRDRMSTHVSLQGVLFELVDTGGVGLRKEEALREDVQRQIDYAIQSASAVLFVVDATAGVMALDREIARQLRRLEKEVILVVNKADHSGRDGSVNEFAELGFEKGIAVSAAHRRNLDTLTDRLVERWPGRTVPPAEGLKIAVVGRRNVGKSTYVNALCGEERVIVSDIPGTTRDAVDVRLVREGKVWVLIDTAGLRKKTKVADTVELFSRDRTEKAVDRADVVFFMFDVTEKVSQVDKKLASKIEDRKVPCVVLLNKWDQVPKGFQPQEFITYLGKAMPLLGYSPVAVISAKKGDRIWEPLELAADLHAQSGTKIPTPLINRALQKAQSIRAPGSRGGKSPKILYAAQTGVQPPSFSVFVNDPLAFSPDYVRYLENKFRELLPFRDVPIRLRLKPRHASRESPGQRGRA